MSLHGEEAASGVSRLKSAQVPLSDPHYIVLSLLNRWLSEKALPFATGRMLDMGCGARPYEDLFGPRIDQYLGADVAPSKDSHIDIVLTPGEPVALDDNSVDTILSTQTLEHVYDFQVYLAECARLLKPGGVLILTVPMQWRIHETPHDYWRFTRFGVVKALGEVGLNEVIINSCGGAWALVGQIIASHLVQRKFESKIMFLLINRIALRLDAAYPDPDETLLWMGVFRKP